MAANFPQQPKTRWGDPKGHKIWPLRDGDAQWIGTWPHMPRAAFFVSGASGDHGALSATSHQKDNVAPNKKTKQLYRLYNARSRQDAKRIRPAALRERAQRGRTRLKCKRIILQGNGCMRNTASVLFALALEPLQRVNGVGSLTPRLGIL